MVVDAALQEDRQVIGLSIHSGAHMTLFPAVVQELKRRKATDIVVFGGGIIPDDDIVALKQKGVAELFTPGTPLQGIVDWLWKRFPCGARERPTPVSSGSPPNSRLCRANPAYEDRTPPRSSRCNTPTC